MNLGTAANWASIVATAEVTDDLSCGLPPMSDEP